MSLCQGKRRDGARKSCCRVFEVRGFPYHSRQLCSFQTFTEIILKFDHSVDCGMRMGLLRVPVHIPWKICPFMVFHVGMFAHLNHIAPWSYASSFGSKMMPVGLLKLFYNPIPPFLSTADSVPSLSTT